MTTTETAEARARIERYIAEYEDAQNWGGPTNYPAAPKIADLRLLIASLTPPAQGGEWKCSTLTYQGQEPQDCNWPHCGCDQKATEVLQALDEHGYDLVDRHANLVRKMKASEAYSGELLKPSSLGTMLSAIPDASPGIANVSPIPMLLWCPRCHVQHIDEPDERTPDWSNPPHRSHLCHACGCIWRPADVPTEGRRAITTHGKADTFESAAPTAERLRSALEKAEGALSSVDTGVFRTFKFRNGRERGIEADDGEACDIMHSDITAECRGALVEARAALSDAGEERA